MGRREEHLGCKISLLLFLENIIFHNAINWNMVTTFKNVKIIKIFILETRNMVITVEETSNGK